jgi:deazaflavin-dependent oxidoreductase (nitroreductase family)
VGPTARPLPAATLGALACSLWATELDGGAAAEPLLLPTTGTRRSGIEKRGGGAIGLGGGMATTTKRDEGMAGGTGRNEVGRFSRWMQHYMNGRMIKKVRKGKGSFMGMDVLVLGTTGRRSGERRETPVAWFPDADSTGGDSTGSDSRVIVASGGDTQHPDWFLNLMAHRDEASMELPGEPVRPVEVQQLEGEDREQAWARIAAAAPRIAKYQAKSERVYPLVRLTPAPG